MHILVPTHLKKQFWEEMDNLVKEIPTSKEIFLGGDLNGHVRKDTTGCERVHGGQGLRERNDLGGQGFGKRNEYGDNILKFAIAFDLLIAKTYFRRKEKHLITYKSGINKSQIGFFLPRKHD